MQSDFSGPAIAVGGPLDGEVLGESGPDEYNVRMADDAVHAYRRTTDATTSTSGRTGTAYAWAGRV